MDVDKAGTDGHAGRIPFVVRFYSGCISDQIDPAILDDNVILECRRAGAIDNLAVADDQFSHRSQ